MRIFGLVHSRLLIGCRRKLMQAALGDKGVSFIWVGGRVQRRFLIQGWAGFPAIAVGHKAVGGVRLFCSPDSRNLVGREVAARWARCAAKVAQCGKRILSARLIGSIQGRLLRRRGQIGVDVQQRSGEIAGPLLFAVKAQRLRGCRQAVQVHRSRHPENHTILGAARAFRHGELHDVGAGAGQDQFGLRLRRAGQQIVATRRAAGHFPHIGVGVRVVGLQGDHAAAQQLLVAGLSIRREGRFAQARRALPVIGRLALSGQLCSHGHFLSIRRPHDGSVVLPKDRCSSTHRA